MSQTSVALLPESSEHARFEKARFMGALSIEFKLFLMDCVMDGVADCFDDHFEFMQYALDRFIEMSSSKEEGD